MAWTGRLIMLHGLVEQDYFGLGKDAETLKISDAGTAWDSEEFRTMQLELADKPERVSGPRIGTGRAVMQTINEDLVEEV